MGCDHCYRAQPVLVIAADFCRLGLQFLLEYARPNVFSNCLCARGLGDWLSSVNEVSRHIHNQRVTHLFATTSRRFTQPLWPSVL